MDNSTRIHNTEDKDFWVKLGAGKEKYFVHSVAPLVPLNAIINPDKEHNDYAPDLLVDGALADLKVQNTPFFTAQFLYGIPAQYAVTFNNKDFERYSLLYPDILIVFWISWDQISYKELTVKPMAGVWSCPFKDMAKSIKSKQIQLHKYKRRQEDTKGNAKESYVFDIRNFKLLKKFI